MAEAARMTEGCGGAWHVSLQSMAHLAGPAQAAAVPANQLPSSLERYTDNGKRALVSVLAYMFHPTPSPFRYFSAWPAMALLALGAPQWAGCEPPRPVAEAALDMYTPVAFDQQRFAGQFGERTRANIEGYLERVDAPRLLKPFQERSADALDPLLAEGAGLYLVAASNSTNTVMMHNCAR